ncbi:MAG TPA: holo-ACP synthase [Spirochaetota bacterium]|nr:holo-ACP synthase [Spirochaetota bacterium]HOM38947.1 holo-ACP synthase [Spirochaetota bacterium]HPQ49205.1 holo-ACP synthase [Spirochaetota bacterium]
MIGLDIIEISRIEKVCKKNKNFINKILSKSEIDILNSIKSEKRKYEFIAGRFAAKEAFMKALGKGVSIGFSNIEVLNNDLGKPYIVYYGNLYDNISISHSKDYAVAIVII